MTLMSVQGRNGTAYVSVEVISSSDDFSRVRSKTGSIIEVENTRLSYCNELIENSRTDYRGEKLFNKKMPTADDRWEELKKMMREL